MITTILLIALGQTGMGGGGAFGDVAGDNTVSAVGSVVTGSGTCVVGVDSVLRDNNGDQGCQNAAGGGATPQDYMIRPQPADPAGTVTAADINIFAGQDSSLVRIDAADPSATCPTDTVTIARYDSNNASTTTVATEGTNWTATASVANTCASLATYIDGLSGVGATCTSPNVLITLDPGFGALTLAESDGNCTGVATGTPGFVNVPAYGTGGVQIAPLSATTSIVRNLNASATSLCLGAVLGSTATVSSVCAIDGGFNFYGSSSGFFQLATATSNIPLSINSNQSATGTTAAYRFQPNNTFTHSSTTALLADFTATYNQSATGAFTVLGLTVTTTAVGSGVKSLILAKDDTVQKFRVDIDGSVESAGGLITSVLEENLTAGACTAGKWRVDNTTTRELCRCNDAGSAYDCISVIATNGPLD